MAFTTAEIQEIKNRLSAGNLTASARPYVDVARLFEDVIQNYTDAYGEGFIKGTILVNLRLLDTEIMAARTRYKASRLEGEITLNPREHENLVALELHWTKRLARTLCIYDQWNQWRSSGSTSSSDVY